MSVSGDMYVYAEGKSMRVSHCAVIGATKAAALPGAVAAVDRTRGMWS